MGETPSDETFKTYTMTTVKAAPRGLGASGLRFQPQHHPQQGLGLQGGKEMGLGWQQRKKWLGSPCPQTISSVCYCGRIVE